MQDLGAGWPQFDEEQIDAVAEVLRSGRVNYWTGNQGVSFEREFAQLIGVERAIFLANGTVALELAIRGLNLPPGSEIVTTPRTFIATASSIVNCGHVPVFADIDPDSGNITAQSVEKVLTERTSAVLVVHLGGWPADLPGLRALCDDRGLALIEDCAQAHGAMVGDAQVGAFGDVSAWSFCQDKIITTGGEGGMVTTNDEARWGQMWSYKDHGKDYHAVHTPPTAPGYRWLHETFGTNWRGTEMQAAIGRLQYRRLESWRAERTSNALHLVARLSGVEGLTVPLPGPGLTHAFYRLYVYVDQDALAPGWSRDVVFREVELRHGIRLFSGSSSEIYLERSFQNSGLAPAVRLPEAQRMTHSAVALLVHPGLRRADLDRVADAIIDVMADATVRGYSLAVNT